MTTPTKPTTSEEYRAFILSFIASLTLADHMGDAADDIETALTTLEVPGISGNWDDLYALGKLLGKAGVPTLNGTLIGREDDDDEGEDDAGSDDDE